MPIENLVEKDLNLENKKDIEEYGIDKFNEAARGSVLRYDKDWKETVPRFGRFIDMEGGYKTMDWQYSESIWWAFKDLYDKDLIYKGYKAMHICPRCETTLSDNEVSEGYKDVKDFSVVAKFKLKPGQTYNSGLTEVQENTYVLAWTTTPWTLPGNVALAVGEDISYVRWEQEGEFFILAEKLAQEYFPDFNKEDSRCEDVINLEGLKYEPLFDYYAKNEKLENRENGWKIYAADFVTTEDGTGVVHIAPAFGSDDMALGKEHNLPFVQHVGMDGRFKKEVTDFADAQVKSKDDPQATDIEIIKYLAHNGKLFEKKKYEHSYPHCWRCDTPLLNYAADSWFVKVPEIKDKAVAENKKIKWIPEKIGSARFGNLLQNAPDWAISRSRYWGAPLPVWEAESGERIAIGSIGELKKYTKKSGNKYFIMRHGESESNVNNVVSSKVDNGHGLTLLGKKQTIKSAKILKREDIDIIFSSDYLRTKETAEIAAEQLGISKDEIIFDERIREINTGIFNGKSTDEYHAHFSGGYLEKFTKTPPEGENLNDLKNRVMDFLYELEEKHTNKNILIFTHEYPSWMIDLGAEGGDAMRGVEMKEPKPDYLKNAEVMKLDFVPLPHNENYELDLHRPYIDEVVLEKDGMDYKRIPEVFDCWFESGSMPYASIHYPFENRELFKKNFPADFIAEGLDQTRGWFNKLLVLSVGLFGHAPYKNVIVNGLILAEDGKKMSKKLKNYPDPIDMANKYGADSVRYYMLNSPVVRAEELRFSEKGVDEIYKKIVLRLGNVLSFYQLYEKDLKAKSSKLKASDNVLDKWILARTNGLIEEVSEGLDNYEMDKATRPFLDYVDDLSTWYLRRSRDRFKGEDEKDKDAALSTTHYCLLTMSKLLAPFMPFLAEDVYGKLGGDMESVHLENWVKAQTGLFGRVKKKDGEVLKQMQEIRDIVSLGLEARATVGIKVRQPLAALKIKNNKSKIQNSDELLELIKDEVNVKKVEFVEIKDLKIDEAFDVSTARVELDTNITEELKREGQMRELLRQIQSLRKKENLTPDDVVELKITTGDAGKKLIKEFEESIKSVAGLKEIVLTDSLEGEDVKVDDLNFVLKIKK
ncbi:class I tRNA ligase family protein [Patescibacteria group bacterium]